jgi:hypothetical protein
MSIKYNYFGYIIVGFAIAYGLGWGVKCILSYSNVFHSLPTLKLGSGYLFPIMSEALGSLIGGLIAGVIAGTVIGIIFMQMYPNLYMDAATVFSISIHWGIVSAFGIMIGRILGIVVAYNSIANAFATFFDIQNFFPDWIVHSYAIFTSVLIGLVVGEWTLELIFVPAIDLKGIDFKVWKWGLGFGLGTWFGTLTALRLTYSVFIDLTATYPPISMIRAFVLGGIVNGLCIGLVGIIPTLIEIEEKKQVDS